MHEAYCIQKWSPGSRGGAGLPRVSTDYSTTVFRLGDWKKKIWNSNSDIDNLPEEIDSVSLTEDLDDLTEDLNDLTEDLND